MKLETKSLVIRNIKPRSHVKVYLQWPKAAVLFEWNMDMWTICIDAVSMIPESIFFLWKVALYTGFLPPKGLRIMILTVADSNCNNHSKQFQQSQNISWWTFKMFKVPALKKYKKEDNTKKWKRFSMSLNRFGLDDVSNFKIIDRLVLKLLMSLRVSHEYGVLQLSY